jgi:hypothetical protein
MNEQEFHAKLGELITQIDQLPPGPRAELSKLAEETRARHSKIRQTVKDLQDSLDYLRLSVKYLVFDLEATRRENAYLRKMLEQSQKNDPRCDDCGRTAARTAGNAFGIARIARDLDGRVLGRRSHGEFVHVGASEWYRSRRTQFFDHRGVVGRDVTGENFRGASAGLPLDIDHILDRNGNAAERQGRVRFFRGGPRTFVIARKITTDLRVGFFDGGIDRVDQLDGRQLARSDHAACLGNGESGEVHQLSTTLGTMKSPLPE